MAIARRNRMWDPVGELDRVRREIEQVFDPPSRGTFSDGLFEREFSPALDVVEKENEFLVSVDLPGVDKKDLSITVADTVRTLKGEKHTASEARDAKVYRKETWDGTFERTLSLPQGVDTTRIEAKMLDGVLQVLLPKREEVKPRQIAVKVS
ncbi:MAG: Hsp20/alpha crystallin family protein [Spirochaetales bacterium]|nr:MAG: Hsp20/alpha crystallin family protein [Spirochaetales bacterium]